jgi:phage terminase large subunit
MSEVKFNRVYREANETTKRYRILLGSAGSGKSVDVAQDYILKLSNPEYRGANLMVVRATESSHLNSTFAELVGAISRAGLTHLWAMRTAPLSLECTLTGCSIIFRGCNDTRAIERVKSVSCKRGKLTWIWVEEATELRASDFEILDDRLRGELPSPSLYYQLTLTFNPIDAQHWIKLNLWDIDNPEFFKLKTTYLQNAFIDEAYKRRMERRAIVDPEGYRVYGLAEWGDTGGNILRNYTLSVCSKDYDWYDSILMSQDFGFNHADCLLVVGYKDDNMYVIKELFEYEKHTGELIELAKDMDLPMGAIMYCDSAEPDRIKEWKQAGFKAQGVCKDKGSVKAQIDYLKQRHIYIDPGCPNTFREAQQWRWKKDSNGLTLDEPLEVEDDAMAALRYATEPFRRVRKMRTLDKRALGLR